MVSLLSSISEDSEGKKRFSLSLALRHVVQHMCSMTLQITATSCNHGWGRTERKEFLHEDRAFSLSRNRK